MPLAIAGMVTSMVLLAGFLLVQAIGWVTTAAAAYVRQYFVPFALTFVLVLGVPTSGGSVAPDMLPLVLAALHHVLPLAAFVDVVRASAYGVGSLAIPGAVLLGWTALGAGLMVLAHRRRRQAHRAAAASDAVSAIPLQNSHDRSHTVFGAVSTLSGEPLGGAIVMVLDDSGTEVERATAHEDGIYAAHGVSVGLHHLVVTAPHCEPSVVTFTVHADRRVERRDVRLQDWQDPAANLVGSDLD